MPYAKKTNSPASPSAQLTFEAEPYHYQIPDAELLDDLAGVARKLGVSTIPAQQYQKHGRFSAQTYRDRFGTWNAALQRAQLQPSTTPFITDEAMLQDIVRVAEKLNTRDLPRDAYGQQGKYSSTTIVRRFGKWTTAKLAAGLLAIPPKPHDQSTEELLANFESVWRTLGHQPRSRDLTAPNSQFSLKTYLKHFGTFRSALSFFVQHQRQNGKFNIPVNPPPVFIQRKTQRFVRVRLRYQVLHRDHFRCRLCGRSPATNPAVQLEVDHIHPWSQGGETIKENLQTLCDTCNGGKGDTK